jgi:hypothetical protein
MVMPPLVSRSSSDSSLVALLSIALLILCSAKASVMKQRQHIPLQQQQLHSVREALPEAQIRCPKLQRGWQQTGDHTMHAVWLRQDASFSAVPVDRHANAWVPWLHCCKAARVIWLKADSLQSIQRPCALDLLPVRVAGDVRQRSQAAGDIHDAPACMHSQMVLY